MSVKGGWLTDLWHVFKSGLLLFTDAPSIVGRIGKNFYRANEIRLKMGHAIFCGFKFKME